MFALNYLLQTEQVNSGSEGSDDDLLALALHTLRFRSASQTLVINYHICPSQRIWYVLPICEKNVRQIDAQ